MCVADVRNVKPWADQNYMHVHVAGKQYQQAVHKEHGHPCLRFDHARIPPPTEAPE